MCSCIILFRIHFRVSRITIVFFNTSHYTCSHLLFPIVLRVFDYQDAQRGKMCMENDHLYKDTMNNAHEQKISKNTKKCQTAISKFISTRW